MGTKTKTSIKTKTKTSTPASPVASASAIRVPEIHFRIKNVDKPIMYDETLSVEQKTLYFSANWKLKFKDLERTRTSTTSLSSTNMKARKFQHRRGSRDRDSGGHDSGFSDIPLWNQVRELLHRLDPPEDDSYDDYNNYDDEYQYQNQRQEETTTDEHILAVQSHDHLKRFRCIFYTPHNDISSKNQLIRFLKRLDKALEKWQRKEQAALQKELLEEELEQEANRRDFRNAKFGRGRLGLKNNLHHRTGANASKIGSNFGTGLGGRFGAGSVGKTYGKRSIHSSSLSPSRRRTVDFGQYHDEAVEDDHGLEDVDADMDMNMDMDASVNNGAGTGTGTGVRSIRSVAPTRKRRKTKHEKMRERILKKSLTTPSSDEEEEEVVVEGETEQHDQKAATRSPGVEAGAGDEQIEEQEDDHDTEMGDAVMMEEAEDEEVEGSDYMKNSRKKEVIVKKKGRRLRKQILRVEKDSKHDNDEEDDSDNEMFEATTSTPKQNSNRGVGIADLNDDDDDDDDDDGNETVDENMDPKPVHKNDNRTTPITSFIQAKKSVTVTPLRDPSSPSLAAQTSNSSLRTQSKNAMEDIVTEDEEEEEEQHENPKLNQEEVVESRKSTISKYFSFSKPSKKKEKTKNASTPSDDVPNLEDQDQEDEHASASTSESANAGERSTRTHTRTRTPESSPIRKKSSRIDDILTGSSSKTSPNTKGFMIKRPRHNPPSSPLRSPTAVRNPYKNAFSTTTTTSSTLNHQSNWKTNGPASSSSTSSPPSNRHVGLRNLGNTCYLNSSLQILFSVPGFIDDLYKTYQTLLNERGANANHDSNENNKTPNMPLCRALLKVASMAGILKPSMKGYDKRSTAATPTILKTAMDELTDKFIGYEQRDAHEFLSDLIDLLHDELSAASGVEMNDGEEKKCNIRLPTDEYFRMEVDVCLTCSSCKYSRSKTEMYRHLSLDVGTSKDGNEPSLWTIEKGLEQFFRLEKRDIKCEKCENGKSAMQTMSILSRPKALLIHLKRFIVESNTNNGQITLRKNVEQVKADNAISLRSFSKNGEKGYANLEKSDDDNYDILGVVRHIGSTANSGHYTADARRVDTSSKNEWVSFDDGGTSVIRDIDRTLNSERCRKSNYIMMYGQKSS